MKLVGEKVKHKTFGRGKVVEFDGQYIFVDFKDSEVTKKFPYPDAIGKFIEFDNDATAEKVEGHKQKEEAKEQKRAAEKRSKKMRATFMNKFNDEQEKRDKKAKAAKKAKIVKKAKKAKE